MSRAYGLRGGRSAADVTGVGVGSGVWFGLFTALSVSVGII